MRDGVERVFGALADPNRRFVVETLPLGDAVEWMERVGRTWDERLAALSRHVTERGRG